MSFFGGSMTNIELRAIQEADYILKNKSTIRACAKVFGVSKSTVHFDISVKLKKINFALYQRLKGLLDKNFEEKHIRGGLATKNKYKKMSKSACLG